MLKKAIWQVRQPCATGKPGARSVGQPLLQHYSGVRGMHTAYGNLVKTALNPYTASVSSYKF